MRATTIELRNARSRLPSCRAVTKFSKVGLSGQIFTSRKASSAGVKARLSIQMKGNSTSSVAASSSTKFTIRPCAEREPGSSLRGFLTWVVRSEEHTSELQSRGHLVCRLLLEKKNNSMKV